MKLKSLAVSNFRSLADVELLLHDLNVIIGPIKSGKTALLEVLHMLSLVWSMSIPITPALRLRKTICTQRPVIIQDSMPMLHRLM